VNTDHTNSIPVFRLGDGVTFDTAARTQRRLIVAEIRQFTGGPVSLMVDYVLVDDPGPQVRLRFLPSENAKARPLILTLYDSLPYGEGLLAVVRDESARLAIHGDTDAANVAGDIFWRIYDVKHSHVSIVNIRSNTGVTNAVIEYWDYSRLTDVEGVETEEFIFVEMNKADGFQIWRGVEVAAGKIVAA
jgi:hypothetical protein